MMLLILTMCSGTLPCLPVQEVQWYDRGRGIIAFPSAAACAERRDWIESQQHATIMAVGCYSKPATPAVRVTR